MTYENFTNLFPLCFMRWFTECIGNILLVIHLSEIQKLIFSFFLCPTKGKQDFFSISFLNFLFINLLPGLMGHM